MINSIFTVSGTEELRSVSGLIARAVCPAPPCLGLCPAELFWYEPTILTISPTPPHPLPPPLLMGRVKPRW